MHSAIPYAYHPDEMYQELSTQAYTNYRLPMSKSAIGNRQYLNSAPLRGPTTIMWNGCRIANRGHSDSGIGDCPDCGFAAATRPLNANLTLLHSRLVGLFRGFVSGLLSRERS